MHIGDTHGGLLRRCLVSNSAALLQNKRLLTVKLSSHFVASTDWIRRHDSVRQIGIGMLSVAAAMLVKLAVKDVSAGAPSSVLFDGAIAVATWFGGWPGGV